MAEKTELTHEEKVRNFKNRLCGRKKTPVKKSAPRNGQKNFSEAKQAKV